MTFSSVPPPSPPTDVSLIYSFFFFFLDGGPRSAGWRDHAGPGESRRRKFDFDFRDSEGHSGGRRRAGSDGLEDERDGLPEWCTDEEDGEMGTFDSSGAFMPMKVCFIIELFTFPLVMKA